MSRPASRTLLKSFESGLGTYVTSTSVFSSSKNALSHRWNYSKQTKKFAKNANFFRLFGWKSCSLLRKSLTLKFSNTLL